MMNQRSFRFFLAVILGTVGTCFAGATYTEIDAGEVFVATVTRLEDEGATNANPPKIWLEVHEVLRGRSIRKRSPVLWSPPHHDFDYSEEGLAALKRWEATPMKGPKVGEKFILGGQFLAMAEGDYINGDYVLLPFVRTPYSDEARQRTIVELKRLVEMHKKNAARRAAESEERTSRKQAWRATLDAKRIDHWTRKADAVAIGTHISGNTFCIKRMLKGRERMLSGTSYLISLPPDRFDKRIVDLVIGDRPTCVLFISEERIVAGASSVEANLIDPYEGAVLADAAAIAAVEASLKKHPAPVPRPVLVISQLDREDLSAIVSAAQAKFEVVLSHQFSIHSPKSVKHVRRRIPHAAGLLMIGRGPERHVHAVRIEKTEATTIYEATWPKDGIEDHIEPLLKTLAEELSLPTPEGA
jgi:hypothetical protein